MKKFYIADLHLFHGSVLAGGKFHERPYKTMDEMIEGIIANWNKTVSNGDIVYLLGDVSFKGNVEETAEILSQFKGQITLVRGNHDGVTKDQRIRKQFVEIVDYKETTDTVRGKTENVVLSHYPIFSWNGRFRGSIHLYGHVHDTDDDVLFKNAIKTANQYFKERDRERHEDFRAYNVGCMKPYMNFTPKTLEEIIALNT